MESNTFILQNREVDLSLYHFFINILQAFFFGFGIYSQGGALDGGVLRFLYEFGFLWFLYLIYSINRISTIFLLILLSVNLLFDAYMSSVVMPFFNR